jgi:hypothetical protein
MNPRLSLTVRAIVGVFIVLLVGSLFLFYPLGLHWLRDHKLVDAAAIIAGIAFHLWNTYAPKFPRSIS